MAIVVKRARKASCALIAAKRKLSVAAIVPRETKQKTKPKNKSKMAERSVRTARERTIRATQEVASTLKQGAKTSNLEHEKTVKESTKLFHTTSIATLFVICFTGLNSALLGMSMYIWSHDNDVEIRMNLNWEQN